MKEKYTASSAEVASFAQHLKDLHGSGDTVFEMEDVSKRMKSLSLDDVMASFQNFLDTKADTFKVRVTQKDCVAGLLWSRTTEFKRLSQPTQ